MGLTGVLMGLLTFLGRMLVATFAVVVVAGSLGAGVVFGYQLWYADRIYPGVRAMGIDLSGRSPSEARLLLETHFQRYAQAPLPLHYTNTVWQVTPATLGLRFDSQQTVAASLTQGRQGDLRAQLTEQYFLLRQGHDVPLALTVDQPRTIEVLTKINAEVRQLPTNATLEVRSDGTIAINNSRPGQEIAVEDAADHVRRALLKMSREPIVLPTRPVLVKLTEEQLVVAQQRAQELIGKPLTLRTGDRDWLLTPRELSQFVVVREELDGARVEWQDLRWGAQLDQIAKLIARSPVDARLTFDGTTVQLTPSAAGAQLDVNASLAAIYANVSATQRDVDLVVRTIPPRVTTAQLEPVHNRLVAYVSAPLTLVGDDREWTLDVPAIAQLVRLSSARAPEAGVHVELDRAGLAAFVEQAAPLLERQPRNARLTVRDGKLLVAQREEVGRKVDVQRTIDALIAAAATDARRVPPIYTPVAPPVTAAMADQLAIRDMIMDAKTPYGGGLAERLHNIELAASRLDGTVVPPGATFSFNEALGPATLRSGFKVGYGILLNNQGEMQTVPSEAGGICQVATTLFHAVFWAGYPIVERNWHLYWIPRYGLPPKGLKGLDATVDEDYLVDFKFKNSTDNYLVIVTKTDGKDLTFALYGIKPDWQVHVAEPVITNIVPADKTTVVRKPDPSLAPGRELQIEAATDGFDVAITRTVTRGDQVIERWTARARYRPSRNVVLYGPKPAEAAAIAPAGDGEAAPPAAATPNGDN